MTLKWFKNTKDNNLCKLYRRGQLLFGFSAHTIQGVFSIITKQLYFKFKWPWNH